MNPENPPPYLGPGPRAHTHLIHRTQWGLWQGLIRLLRGTLPRISTGGWQGAPQEPPETSACGGKPKKRRPGLAHCLGLLGCLLSAAAASGPCLPHQPWPPVQRLCHTSDGVPTVSSDCPQTPLLSTLCDSRLVRVATV
uniref:Uncharacterized protein n=1 Tax=Sciurus vulgaris TaxID=55149 RepID=A0A8D2AMU4_SCIVU